MRKIVFCCVAVALLAGCGAPPQPPIGAPGAMLQGAASPAYAARRTSWMLPEAKSEDLLYVTSFVSSYVFVFSYPEGKLVGKLGGFSYAASGECSDNQGDVFVIGSQEVVEYAHGGSNPIATLTSVNYPRGCAVDPVTGNLAVAGGSPHDYEANVAIFPNAKAPPTLYFDGSVPAFNFCTFDARGNLFVNAYGAGSSELALDELANGSSSFTRINVSLKNQGITAGGAVQWSGKYLVLGDPHGNGIGRHGPTTIYQVALSGSTGKVVKTIELFSGKAEHGKSNRNPGTPVEFWIQGKTIVNPLRYARDVGIWSYPSGGYPTKKILGVSLAYGVTVSLAPR